MVFTFLLSFYQEFFSVDFFGDVLVTRRLIIDPLLFVVTDSSLVCSTTVGRLPREFGDLTVGSGFTLLPTSLLFKDFGLLSAFKVSFSGMGSS